MKTLILLRHAKSSWKHPELPDNERPLNSRGKRDAPVMVNRLIERRIKPDLIISSPATRALQTANIFAKRLNIYRKEILVLPTLYLDGTTAIINTIRKQPDALDTLMLVGHNPDMTELANFLCNTHIDNIPTCGIFAMSLDIMCWHYVDERKGRLLFFDYPKKLNLK